MSQKHSCHCWEKGRKNYIFCCVQTKTNHTFGWNCHTKRTLLRKLKKKLMLKTWNKSFQATYTCRKRTLTAMAQIKNPSSAKQWKPSSGIGVFLQQKYTLPFLSEVDSNFFNWPKWTKPSEYIIFCCLIGYFTNVHNTSLFLQSYRTLKF